jgi:hypothetical protein
MKVTLLKLDKYFLHPAKTSANNATIKRESLLFHAQFGSAITTARVHTQNLLLPSVQDNSAIMMATHTSYSLQLIVDLISIKQSSTNIINGDCSKLIVIYFESKIFLHFCKDCGKSSSALALSAKLIGLPILQQPLIELVPLAALAPTVSPVSMTSLATIAATTTSAAMTWLALALSVTLVAQD